MLLFFCSNPLSGQLSNKTEQTPNNPSPSYGNLTGIQWNEYNISNHQYLDMNKTGFYMTPIQENTRMDLWYNVYKDYKNENTKNDNEDTTNCTKCNNSQKTCEKK